MRQTRSMLLLQWLRMAGFVMVGALLLVGSVIEAQTSTFGLSADDFALLKAANSTLPKSFAFQYTAQFASQNLDTLTINANVKGSGAVDSTAHQLAITLNGPFQLGTMPANSINAEVRWVGNNFYFNPGDSWQMRADASAFVAGLIHQIGEVETTPAKVAKWDTSGVAGLVAALKAASKLDPSVFLKAGRLADEMVGSTKTAHFQIALNFRMLMQTDPFVDMVIAIAQAQGSSLQAFNRKKVIDIIHANGDLFENSTLTIDQYVDPTNKLLQRVAISANMPFDPMKHGYADKPFTISGKVDMTLTDQNQSPITAPNGAKPVTTFSLLPTTAPLPPGSGLTEYVYIESIIKKAIYQSTFDVQANDQVTITVRGIGQDFAPVAALLSTDGKTLAQDDGFNTHALSVEDFDAQIASFTISKAGTYTAQITEFKGQAGTFILTITIKR